MKDSADSAGTLRSEAEVKLATETPATLQDIPAVDLVHEIQVHQIELEMQNESLRRMQIELEKSLDRYRDLYDFSPVGYLTLDKVGRISQINLTGASLLGENREKLIDTHFARYVHENGRDEWHFFFRSLLKNARSQHVEIELKRVDGSLFVARLDCLHLVSSNRQDASASLYPLPQTGEGANESLRDFNANIEASVRIALADISEKKLTESHLYESEEKLRAILEGAIDGILLVDVLTTKFIFCNDAICRMLGYSQQEIANLYMHDVHARQDIPSIMEKFAKHFRGEADISESIPFMRRDGSIFFTDISSRSIRLNGRLYMVGVIRDITERRRADEALRISGLKYRMLFESSRDALMTLAPPSWEFTDANQATLNLFGVAKACEFVGLAPWRVSPQSQPDGSASSVKAAEMIDIALREGSHFFEWEHQKLDGHSFPAHVLLTRMELEGEIFLQASVRDISGIKQAARLLAQAQIMTESEEKFRKISESAHDAIVMMGSDQCISFWNAAAERIFGYTAAEAIGREMHPLLAASNCTAFSNGFAEFQRTGSGPVIGKMLELSARRKGGEQFPVEVTISALQINRVWNAIGIFRDITVHKLNEEKIRKLAFYDALTQLPNRRLLDDRLEQAMVANRRSGRYGALMFVDLDNFKPLNDNHGHGVGDLLLIEVAQRISRCLREMDTVARFGGDEFVVLLGELDTNKATSLHHATGVAEKIRASLAESYRMTAAKGTVLEHRCTSSIGVVLFHNHETGAMNILKWADMAMYRAKEGGRNRVCFLDPDTLAS